MSSRDEVVQMVEQALTVMYSPTASHEQDRQQAMHWLESFQNSHTAWAMAMHYLTDTTVKHRPEAVFFAAQTLKHKVQVDFAQLDQPGREHLFQTLQGLMYRHDLAKTVRTQILLAMAAYLVQTKTDLMEMKEESVFVELLSLLPEQLSNRAIHLSDEMHSERKQSLLVKHSSTAIPLFLNSLSSADGRGVAVEGLENWIHYAELTEEQAIHILHVASKLVLSECSEDENVAVVEGCCEIVCELVYQRANDSEHFYRQFILLIPTFCQLLSKIYHTDLLKPVGSMVLECAELLMARMLKESSEPTAAAAMQSLIPSILKLANHPDRTIIELTFNFWTELEMMLESDERMREAFTPVYMDLFNSLLPRLQFPVGFNRLSTDEKESFRDFRHIVGDCLKDCVRVIGSTTAVELILTAFDQAHGWQGLEAVLFALRTIASVIDRRESERLPSLFPRLLQLTSPSRLVYSCLLVIGCLSDWLRYHQDLLPVTIDYIVMGMTSRFEEEEGVEGSSELTATAAAMALRYLCESCGELMVRFADQLTQLYLQVQSMGVLTEEEDQLALTESICHVIVADGEQLERLLLIVVNPFMALLHGSDGTLVNRALKHLALFVELVVPDSVSIISNQFAMTCLFTRDIQPLLPSIAERHGAAVSEGLSEICKSSISRYCRSLGQSWLLSVVRLCQTLFTRNQFPLAIYTLRYAVLLGDCDVTVKEAITEHLRANFPLYSTRPLDTLRLVTSMYDYWRGTNNADSITPNLLHMLTVMVQDPSQGVDELCAALMVAMRISMYTTDLLTRFPDYNTLLLVIIQSTLTSFPSQVLSDSATLIHRHGRHTGPDQVLLLFDQVYASMPGIITSTERVAWRQAIMEALMEPRPKALKSALSAQSSAVKRRQ